jgi:type II secretory pathway predicted ATPase ExeA/phage tail protein X
MFLDFWKMREQPFGVTPDPRYLYFSPGHREALATLFYGIETGRGFLSLVAQPGMGKTTLLFQLLRRWKGYVHSAFLFQTQCDSRELIRYLLDDLGLKSDGQDSVRMHSELNDFLLRERKAGKRVVVFIDEAQNLSDTVLETVRLLSNFEAPDAKLLQIVLAGQPELAQRLSHPGLAQLRQRIAVQARLDPLPAPEVVRYVNHRMQVAGYRGPDVFSPRALGTIAELSGGIPRLINVLCFNALSLAFATRSQQISSDMVREAAMDSGLEDLSGNLPQIRQIPDSPNARQVPSPAHSFWPSLRSWIQGFAARRRLVQSSVLLLALGGLGIYLGGHRSAGAASQTAAGRPRLTGEVRSPGLQSSTSRPVADRPITLETGQSAPSDGPDPTYDSFTYVLRHKDTIDHLCLSIFGRDDDEVLSAVLRLNPDLQSTEQLAEGKAIRLPMRFWKPSPAGPARQDSGNPNAVN